ncbi:MAG: prepilin-type cleavage/methylation domain-containing protein [Rubrivivax sp.]|nr:prepilin-type cleavage/methylation domain-containing protein [Rubrivivax sp.]MDP3610663.1 prepilin-type cleavage/methylation domain-containing protein [Rubrivivax sp.]
MSLRSITCRHIRCRPQAGGWTIVELMLALTVVAVLIALAVPAWHKQRNRVLSRHAGQDIGMMAAAIDAYALDHRAYPNSLADVQMGGRVDPWGRPYVYYNVDKRGRGGARKDRALNPINSDFDLYSHGADGVTHMQVSHRNSADDVLRANSGRYVGLGADF